MKSINIHNIFNSLAMRFPVCLASDEFHFFPQARAAALDWSVWDDFSRNALSEAIAQLKEWEQQLYRQLEHPLSFDQQIDSAMVARMLRTLREQFELVRPHETQPTYYLTIVGIGLAEAVEAGFQALEKRSRNLPKFIDQAINNLINVPRLFLEIGMEMLAKQREWVDTLALPDELSVPVLSSLQRFGKHLSQVKVTDEFLPSVDLYERIALEHMGCGIKPGDIASELEIEIEETQSILTQSAKTITANRSWQAIIEDLPRPSLPPGGILDIYRDAIDKLSRHCLFKRMITQELVQKCPVKVEPIPDYMKPVRNNAAYSMPPSHPPRGGTFFLQDASGVSALPADYRLLTAHETYPGHHLLDTCRWRQERPARRHIEYPIFYEGWASFAEELMLETGFFSGPVDRMLMAKRRFWRAVRGKVDFDIHTRRRTLDQAADYLVSQGMAPHRASTLVRRYSLKPGYQLAYTIGRRKFRKLYDIAYPNNKDPVAFARRVLALGEIGFDHLEQAFRQGE